VNVKPAADASGLAVLTSLECRRLLEPGGVGRLAVATSNAPAVRPVNFAVENDRIVITISNRGLRLADKKAPEVDAGEGRRGWGLKLMKNLMDEVKFEQTDDGTRISMTKYLKK